MVDFLDGRLYDVWFDQIFPLLGHNDLLRLRRVCKQTKELATRYLWTPGNQGSWELNLTSPEVLQDVLEHNLPPPSRLYLFLEYEGSFFENEDMTEFLRIYGTFITHLGITDVNIPLISEKEIEFYEGLTNLKSLRIEDLHTGGPAEFEKRSGIDGSRMFPPRSGNLKSLKVDYTDDLRLTWRFIKEIGADLEVLSTPYSKTSGLVETGPLRQSFIESQRNLKYFDCGDKIFCMSPVERIRLFETCFRNGIKMKNVPCAALYCMFLEGNTGEVKLDEVMDEDTGELVYRVNYQRHLFVGNVIHSLKDLRDIMFLMEMPYLEELKIVFILDDGFRIWRRHGHPSWPNLKKLSVTLNCNGDEVPTVRFLLGQDERPKLEELAIRFKAVNCSFFMAPWEIGRTCANLKKLTISGCGASNFFVALWEGLPLLETVNLINCRDMNNEGFIGKGRPGAKPVFLNLERLKHLKIENINVMRINDDLFKLVIRHLRLVSFELTSSRKIFWITVNGIKTLLTGEFAESIERLNLGNLQLGGVSAEEMKELGSLFRSSQML